MEVSVCVLVKNEAQLLRRCLHSVQDEADEIVVVDNGSTDDSPEVAAASGAKLIRHPDANFDEARNAYVEAASRPWILVVDADETLAPGTLSHLKDALGEPEQSGRSAFLLPMYQYVGLGRWTYVHMLRLFRNHPKIRYTTNGIHDTIGYAAMAQGSFGSDLYAPLHHFDALHPGRQSGKRRRNISRLRFAIDHGRFGPNNDIGRMHRYLGVEYAATGERELAKEHFEAAIEACPDTEQNSLVYLAHLYCAEGRFDQAERHVRDLPYDRFGPRVQVPVIRAEVALRRGAVREALDICLSTIEHEPASAHMHVNVAALIVDDSPDEALRHLAAAEELNPYVSSSEIYGAGDEPNLYSFQRSLLSCVTDHRTLKERALRVSESRNGIQA